MHDVGKIGVPDGILFKPGALTGPEYDVIKQHSELGYAILSRFEQPLLVVAAKIARTHHERWNGTGYPRGLAGEAIPVEGRIAAVADVFDAVMSRRCYKPAVPLEQTLEIMADGRGSQFDADIVDLLLDHVDELMVVRTQYHDA
jgi:putative two-component system response regulator